MDPSRPSWPAVVELRQYTLVPGRREELVELFDREFAAPQEALGIRVIGTFRDLDRPDVFVWLRGFPDMAARQAALAAFYGGPVWAAHRDAANATMIDSDDVLLLRPAAPAAAQPTTVDPAAVVTATVWALPAPADAALLAALEDRVEPRLQQAGSHRVALLVTEAVPNSFPALPVREGEHVVVRIGRHDPAADDDVRRAVHDPAPWPAEQLDRLADPAAAPAQHLRLAPTPRSRLR